MVREGWCGWGGKVFVRVRIFLSPLLFQNKFICQTVNCQAVYEESFLPFQKWDLKRWPQWEKKHFLYWWIERRYRCMSPSCMLLRQFQFCLEIPYQLSFRAIIAKEGKILCGFKKICHHLFPVLMQYVTRLERKYVISLTMVLC